MTPPCHLADSTMHREITRHSARFNALRAASGADGSRPIPTLLPEKGLFHKKCRPKGGIPYLNSKGNTAQFPPNGLSTASAAAARHLRCQNARQYTKYCLRFWLSICRTSLAVSALRIMRYCLNSPLSTLQKKTQFLTKLRLFVLERPTRLELATSTLARWRSTR